MVQPDRVSCRAQPCLLNALIQYLTVLLEYLDLCNLGGQAQQAFGRARALPASPLATPLVMYKQRDQAAIQIS